MNLNLMVKIRVQLDFFFTVKITLARGSMCGEIRCFCGGL